MFEGYLNAKDFGAAGSVFSTRAHSVAGSAAIVAEEIGDFKVGDEVFLRGVDPHIESAVLFERKDMSARNRRPWKFCQPLDGRVEFDGYDGSQGDWVVYFIDMWPESPDTFRWSNNFGIDWHDGIPYSDGWTVIDGSVRVKINDFKEREWGCTAAIVCSSRKISTVYSIDGNTLTLSDALSSSGELEIMHSDSAAIQRAIDAALEQKKSVFLPNGRYRLTSTLVINEPSGFVFAGENAVETVIDNSIGALGIETLDGSCFFFNGGEAVTLKNVSMIGCYGFKEKARGANLFCKGGSSVYGFYFQKSNATCTKNTKRVMIENCHAKRMSAECFYSMGTPRELADPGDRYTRSITYQGCSVVDSARNAFNNNDKAECTSILNCRIEDVGNAAWEGASRFVKIQGCYVKNAGAIAIGNVRRRGGIVSLLGTGQHVISDNYFEGCTQDHSVAMIKIGSFASQVVIKGNVFVNFNSPAIDVHGEGQSVDTPPENIIITANSIDLTAIGEPGVARYGIRITSNYVTASDNQIFVRTERDEKADGIIISDDVTRVNVHDNTITGLGIGIKSETVSGYVGDVVDERTFYRAESGPTVALKPMLPREFSHGYKGWRLRWIADGSESEILEFDPIGLSFTLVEPRDMKSGDKFLIYGPNELPWLVHHNIIDNCTAPMDLGTFSGERAVLDKNIY